MAFDSASGTDHGPAGTGRDRASRGEGTGIGGHDTSRGDRARTESRDRARASGDRGGVDGRESTRSASMSGRPSAASGFAADPRGYTAARQSVDPRVAESEKAAREALRESFLGSRGDGDGAYDSQAAFISGLKRQGLVPQMDATGAVIGSIPERRASVDLLGRFQPGTGAFAPENLGQFGVPENASARQRLEALGLYDEDLPSAGRRVGSLLGLAGPAAGVMGSTVGAMVDAARLRSGLTGAGIDPDMAGAIVGRVYGPALAADMIGSTVGGPLARKAGTLAYNLGGPEAAVAAASGTNAALGAAGDYISGSSLDAPLSAEQARQITANRASPSSIGGGREPPWFERVASSMETPIDAVADQPPSSSTAPAIPSRLNYLEDSVANTAMQYASNANYQPRAVYSDGASAGASGTYYGNAPASGTVRLS